MAVSEKLRGALRDEYTSKIATILKDAGEDVYVVGSNAFAIPCVDAEGNEWFAKFVVSIPTGSRDGDPYDGYGEAESYALKVKQNAEKKAEQEAKKAAKAAKDKAAREAKVKAKAEHLAKTKTE